MVLPGPSGGGDGAQTNPPGSSSSLAGLPPIQRLIGRENWSTWKYAVQMYLEHEDLWEVVQPTPNEDGTLPAVNAKLDRKTRAKIAMLVDPENYVHIQEAKTARESWIKLEETFGDLGPERKVGLLCKLINTKLVNCSSMADYVNRIVSTSMQLRGIGFKVDEEWVGALLLAGLPPEYKPMVMAISNSGLPLNGDAIKTRLLQEVEEPPVTVALATKDKRYPTKQAGQSKGPKCRSCHKFGHIAKDCQSKNRLGGKGQSALSTVLSTIGAAEEDEWYFDSGATSHLTKDRGLLENLQDGSGTVTAANNGVMKVVATGDAKLKASCCPGNPALDVRNVQLIPELTTNLLSVSQIVEKGNKVIFDKRGCQVVNPDGDVFATGTRVNNLFRFDAVKQPRAMVCSATGQAELWHKRMGHLNVHGLKQLKNGLVTGIQFSDDGIGDCKVCALGKQTRLPFSKAGSRAEELLELVHSDICGPMEETSIGGKRYYITFIDDKSRRIHIYFLKTKSAEEVLAVFREYHCLVERQTGRKLKTIRTDNGKEYINRMFQDYLKTNGIRHQTTVDYTPEQNGMGERVNRSIVERSRCMLFEANLPKRFWAEAASTAVYLLNRSPTKGHTKTPEEVWSGKKPDLSHLRIFGTPVMAHVPKQKRRKWDAKAEECVLVGYEENTKGYRLFNKTTRTITISRDVRFINEGETSHAAVAATEQGAEYVKLDLLESPAQTGTDGTRTTQTGQQPELCQPGPSREPDIPLDLEDQVEDSSDDESAGDTSYETVEEDPADVTVTLSPALPPRTSSNPPVSQVLRRSGRERALPGKLKDFELDNKGVRQSHVSDKPGSGPAQVDDRQGLIAAGRPRKRLSRASSCTDDPCTVSEALDGGQSAQWTAAMQEEYNSLMKNGTWDLVDLPPNRKIVGCKWIFKTKRDSEGKVVRHKARLVAQGFTQKFGYDYDEVFAPVVRQTTFRTLLAVAAKRNMVVKQYDVKTAFLNGDLEEEIYMRQPPAFVGDGNERKVCRLKKSLYGLKQAARSWNTKLHTVLAKQGFTRCKADPCLYKKKNGIDVIAL